jgi:hypothetical protein
MPDYLLLMHNDTAHPVAEWGPYIATLQAGNHLQGGSALGTGLCVRKTGAVPGTTAHLTGFMRITADSLAHAQTLLSGNPVLEAGGTVEIRHLPVTS